MANGIAFTHPVFLCWVGVGRIYHHMACKRQVVNNIMVCMRPCTQAASEVGEESLGSDEHDTDPLRLQDMFPREEDEEVLLSRIFSSQHIP